MNAQPRSPFQRSLSHLRRDPRVLLGLGVITAVLAVAVFADTLSPYDPTYQHDGALTLGPNAKFLLGTDSLGRDILSRILHGSRISMAVAVVTAISALLLGLLYGGISGMAGGAVDALLMRGIDLFYTLPTLLLLILINVVLGQGLTGILVALSLEGMLTVARLVRGQVLQLKQADFVLAARAIGASETSILVKHLLPNLSGPIMVTVTFLIPSNVMYEAFLSFIGLGIPPPYSSWGTLANEGWRGLLSHPHLILFPGIAIFVTMLAFNFLGDGLRDALDPRGASL